MKAAAVQLFAKLYARPAPAQGDPNDRRYCRRTEAWVKRMRPADLDRLLRDED